MKNTDKRLYKRLPGKKKGLYRRVTLWQGKDHLLSVDSNIYQERYQRYYFKEIQGIIIRKTAKGKLLNCFFGVLAVLACILFWAVWIDSDHLWLVYWGIASSIMLLLFFTNVILGPTCTCHIQTPISITELPSLHRLRTARKVRDRIRVMVEKEQGALSPEQILQADPPPRPTPSTSRIVKSHVVRPTSRTISPAGGRSDYSGWAHWTAMAFSLLMAAFLALYLFVYSPVMVVAGVLIGILLLLFNIIALARQVNSAIPIEVKTATWSIMVLIFIVGCGGYFGVLMTVLRDGQVEAMFSQWTLFASMSKIRPMDVPFLVSVLIVGTIGFAVAALFGLISLSVWGRRRQAGAQTVSQVGAGRVR